MTDLTIGRGQDGTLQTGFRVEQDPRTSWEDEASLSSPILAEGCSSGCSIWWKGGCEVVGVDKGAFGGTPKNEFSVEFPYEAFLLVSIQVGLSVVPWARVGKYEMLVSRVTNIPIVEIGRAHV